MYEEMEAKGSGHTKNLFILQILLVKTAIRIKNDNSRIANMFKPKKN